MPVLTFNEVLESIEALSLERQQVLVQIVQQRLRERRREEIRQNAEAARKQFAAGQLPRGTVEDLLHDLLAPDPK